MSRGSPTGKSRTVPNACISVPLWWSQGWLLSRILEEGLTLKVSLLAQSVYVQ
ncbi:hypothetical protein GCM10027612_75050 [Microbispora bryophytorum subsp. camponoti]